MIPLERVHLKEPIDTHDQRNHLVLEARRGWELVVSEDRSHIVARWRNPSGPRDSEYWGPVEFSTDMARHWKPADVADDAMPKAKGKRR